MSLATVPFELLREIIVFALRVHSRPGELLCVNKAFFRLGQPLLHADLDFRSITQLILFSEGTTQLECAPRTLAITLAGGSADFEIFKHMAAALRRCLSSITTSRGDADIGGCGVDGSFADNAKVPLELLSLRLHSHSGNPHLSYIYEALALANPKVFVWRGPDPEHHFSTAIVASATYHLGRAISTWTAVEHITLTNMSFPSDELGWHTSFSDAPLLPPLPRLRTLYIGQATLLPPSAVAAMVARSWDSALERVRLVDTYRHSIWGPRIRRRDVEDAAMLLADVVEAGVERQREVLERVRRIVRCEKKTERIQGGDNGDEQGVLE